MSTPTPVPVSTPTLEQRLAADVAEIKTRLTSIEQTAVTTVKSWVPHVVTWVLGAIAILKHFL
jgi:hypothetical protein